MELHEVRTDRFFVKVPGTHGLRKRAGAELRHLLADGWQEQAREVTEHYIDVRLHRVRHVSELVPTRSPGAGGGSTTPRRPDARRDR